jgi:AAA+ ATPase superfamily predicted ATPase
VQPARPATIFDREREWAELARIHASKRPEVVLVIGRRRVGKSYVLAPFARSVGGLYYQATRRSEAEQLHAMTRLAGERFADPALIHGQPFARWEDILRYLVDKAAGSPFLLVLDEYPYLESAAQGLASVLQSWIDHSLVGTRFKLLLAGSHVSSMKRLEATDQPLYARRTARLVFAPFGYRQAASFCPGYSARDRLAAYGVFGGLPGHLALIDRELGLGENVIRSVLDPTSRLIDEAQHVLDSFLGESEVHYSILSAIGNGEHTWRGITSRIGKSAGSLSRPLQWLLDMEVVRRVVPVTEREPAHSRRALYHLADHYLSFWYRLVSPLLQGGLPATLSPRTIWAKRVAPHLDDHLGMVFEDAARQFVAEGRALPFRPTRVGSWWDARARNEIDVVALSDEGELLVGECKWGKARGADLAVLRERAALLAAELPRVRRVHLALFTGRGLGDRAVREAVAAGDALHYGVEDLFAR